MSSLIKNRLLWSVSFGHFITDLYPNVLPMAFPLLIITLGFENDPNKYVAVALIATMYTLASSLSQPLFGYLADRFGGRVIAPVGIAWLATLIGLVGYIHDYSSLIVLATIAGLGSGAFHPQGAMNASAMSSDRKATAMAIFMLGGNAGFAFGPIAAAAIFGRFGLGGTALMSIPGVLGAIWLAFALRAVDEHRQNAVEDNTQPLQRISVPIIGVASLVLLIMLRSWTQGSITNFVPLLYHDLYADSGVALDVSAQVLFVMSIGVAAGAVIGGILADRIGRKQITFASMILLAPFAYLFLQTVPPLALAVALPLGILMGTTNGITVVMIQEMMPRSMGMASGLALGLSFVTSGIGVMLTGFMADSFGLPSALGFVAILPFIGALLVLNYRPVAAPVVQNG